MLQEIGYGYVRGEFSRLRLFIMVEKRWDGYLHDVIFKGSDLCHRSRLSPLEQRDDPKRADISMSRLRRSYLPKLTLRLSRV